MAAVMAAVKWLLFSIALLHVVGAQEDVICRNASQGRLKNITGVYDSAKFPASWFRNDKAVEYFLVWPESIASPRFRYPCQDNSNLSLLNFTATCDETKGRLDPRPYYDVGLADSLRPYYKHWTYKDILPSNDVPLLCEREDMSRLYSHRIWSKTLRPAIITAIVLLIILESAAIIAAFLCSWALIQTLPKLQIPNLGFKDTIADCLQLLLLTMAGFSMVEAVSHSSSASWRSVCMLDAAVIYTYLTLFALLSSLLRQVASACSPADPGATSGKMNTEEGEGLEQKGNDWRWQRVFTQFAVVMLMTAFLSYNENAMGTALDDLVSVIWSVVVVAGTWSTAVSVVIAARAVAVLWNLLWRRLSRSKENRRQLDEVPLRDMSQR